MIRKIKRDEVVSDYDAVKISLASPEKIKEWSFGEVTKPETLNYRTHKPERDGLFCERIFGPVKDYECSCGKYKKRRFAGTVCDRCGVEVISSRVRRSRMGHIELAVPVSHIWYVKSMPSKVATMLDLSLKDLERVLYYESFIILDPGNSDYDRLDLIDTETYYEIIDKVDDDFQAKIGAEAIRELLSAIDLNNEDMQLKAQLSIETSTLKKTAIVKRLKVVSSFLKSSNRPEWMIMTVLPVLPPTLRPLVPLDGGRFATSDFNDLYRRVIARNNRLKQLISIRAPQVILRNEKRMLQESVDALFDNSRKSMPVRGSGNRPLKSLTDQLKGKQGRFRQNLLGKRVDYSARSVITVGPELRIDQCGLPKEMALELFKPFLIERLEHYGEVEKTKTAKKLIEKRQPKIWKILQEVIQGHPVLLNRAPTLHKLGIQAFYPVLTEDRAIKLHPMVCTPFNADFDGDQMAVHLPLTDQAVQEAELLMLSSRNLLLPASGKLAMLASQDIVLGIYYLTMEKSPMPEDTKKLKFYGSAQEVVAVYENQKFSGKPLQERAVGLHTWIKYKVGKQFLVTTVGRVIFNNIVPEGIEYQNHVFDKGRINSFSTKIFETVGQATTAGYLDRLKSLGFKYATASGITFSFRDVIVPQGKKEKIDEAEKKIDEIMLSYMEGRITNRERENRSVDTWKMVTEEITEELMEEVAKDQDGLNSIHIMHISGARGGKDQIKQLGAMRGLMDKPVKADNDDLGVIETPIKANFKEGLDLFQYFLSTHGSRKGLADTALKTADAGYLTRRLVDVARNAVIKIEDCGTIKGLEVSALKEGLEVVESLSERIRGRVASEDIIHPDTQEVLVEANCEITNELAEEVEHSGVTKVKIRSVLTCEAKEGICAKCYGRNLGTSRMVTIGEPVGVIAAQSIGEPGTQLTLRTFHSGGSASTNVEISERISSVDGIIKYVRMNIIEDPEGKIIAKGHLGKIAIVDSSGKVLEEHKVEYASTVYVKEGEAVVANTKLISWDSYSHPIIATTKGKIEFDGFVRDTTIKEKFNQLTGNKEITIITSKDRKIQPQIRIVAADGNEEIIPLPPNLSVDVQEGDHAFPGSILGRTSRAAESQGDITGGLPRVQELFEARVPKNKAVISEVDGKITIGDLSRTGRKIFVETENGEKQKYIVPLGKRIIVHQGDYVEAGNALSDGPLDPHDVLKAKGIGEAERLILNGIQSVYRKQGVKIDDKHVGVIIKQMLKNVRIVDPGHTIFLQDEIVARTKVMEENKIVEGDEGVGATFEPVLLGITRAALYSDSWLSSASFQETTKILTHSAIEGKVDPLKGQKENIILGHLVPIGTGSKFYRDKFDKLVEEKESLAGAVSSILSAEEQTTETLEDLLGEI